MRGCNCPADGRIEFGKKLVDVLIQHGRLPSRESCQRFDVSRNNDYKALDNRKEPGGKIHRKRENQLSLWQACSVLGDSNYGAPGGKECRYLLRTGELLEQCFRAQGLRRCHGFTNELASSITKRSRISGCISCRQRFAWTYSYT